MTILIFLVIPLGFALVGKLLGLATAASFFYSEPGKRLGRTLSRWCVPILPAVDLALLLCGGDGDAGRGMTLFGSAELFGLLCDIPLYGIPILGVYAGVIYVIRDLTLGHDADRQAMNP